MGGKEDFPRGNTPGWAVPWELSSSQKEGGTGFPEEGKKQQQRRRKRDNRAV